MLKNNKNVSQWSHLKSVNNQHIYHFLRTSTSISVLPHTKYTNNCIIITELLVFHRCVIWTTFLSKFPCSTKTKKVTYIYKLALKFHFTSANPSIGPKLVSVFLSTPIINSDGLLVYFLSLFNTWCVCVATPVVEIQSWHSSVPSAWGSSDTSPYKDSASLRRHDWCFYTVHIGELVILIRTFCIVFCPTKDRYAVVTWHRRLSPTTTHTHTRTRRHQKTCTRLPASLQERVHLRAEAVSQLADRHVAQQSSITSASGVFPPPTPPPIS